MTSDFRAPMRASVLTTKGEIIGITYDATGTTYYAAIWQGKAITSLNTLPGDVNSLDEGINNQGQAVGSTQDSSGNWSHAFLWQNGVMIDINTLFPASSNLYATMANQINDKGQISGMAVVLTGPNAGEVHAFVATPLNASVGRSIADVARTYPKITLPANVGKQLLRRPGLSQFAIKGILEAILHNRPIRNSEGGMHRQERVL
jgi:probable HAF family extracellular repeat protein